MYHMQYQGVRERKKKSEHSLLGIIEAACLSVRSCVDPQQPAPGCCSQTRPVCIQNRSQGADKPSIRNHQNFNSQPDFCNLRIRARPKIPMHVFGASLPQGRFLCSTCWPRAIWKCTIHPPLRVHASERAERNIFYCLSSSQGQAANWLLKDVKAAARSLAQMQIKSSKVREMQLE